MVQNIIIGILIYIGLMVVISLFLQGCTKNVRAFEERQEVEKLKKKQEALKSQRA